MDGLHGQWISNNARMELLFGTVIVYVVLQIIQFVDTIISIISILFRTLCMSDLDFTKESLLNPCICQIQGFSKDSLVKSTFEIHNVRNKYK